MDQRRTWTDNGAEETERRPWGSREQPQMMLDLRLENGDEVGFQYYNLVAPRLSGGLLKLFFEHGTVTIKGRHLRELHRMLLRHCAVYVQERHVSEFEARDTDPYIDRIEFGPADLTSLARRPV